MANLPSVLGSARNCFSSVGRLQFFLCLLVSQRKLNFLQFFDVFSFIRAGFPILTQCHPRLHWDPIRQRCDEPSRAGCESLLPPELPDCPADVPAVNLPHPTSCEMFIACRNGNRIIQRCLHLHYFDIFQSKCLPVHQAVCILDFSGGRRG